MKDIFCASQAATSILEHGSCSNSASTASIQLGGGSISTTRAIDRYNPIIRDSRRAYSGFASAPCTAHQSPISPNPQRKSSAKESDKEKKGSKKPLIVKEDKKNSGGIIKASRWSCTKPGEFITPPGSARYLLSHEKTNYLDALSDFDPVLKLINPTPVEAVKTITDEACPPKPPPASNQVVVLRVSLHCKGCERKMRKHLSRMQGVTSFNIDFAAKKVTVVGDVTPLGVLTSISKVRNAQIWAPTTLQPTPPPPKVISSDLVPVLPAEKIDNISENVTDNLALVN